MNRNLPAVTRETQRLPRTSRKNLSIFGTLGRHALPLTPAGGAVLAGGLVRRVVLLGIHVSSCVSSRLQKGNDDVLSAAFRHLGQRSRRHLRSFNSLDCPRAAGNQRPATGDQPMSVTIDRSSCLELFPLRRPTELPQNPPRSAAAAAAGDAGEAGGGAPLGCCCSCRVKRAGFVCERLDCLCLPHRLMKALQGGREAARQSG